MRIITILLFVAMTSFAMAADKSFSIASPDGKITVKVECGKILTYSIYMNGQTVLAPSPMAMTLSNGTVWGENAKVRKSVVKNIRSSVSVSFYRDATMKDDCTELTLQFKGYNVEVRAYDNGVAYRFVSTTKGDYKIKSETVEYNFTADQTVTNPYIRDYEDKPTFNDQFNNSFENTYSIQPISQMDPKRLSFLPLVVDVGGGKRMCITEVNLESYPGLYLVADGKANHLKGINAPYPEEWHVEGIQVAVDKRADFIAKVSGPRSFPWRIAMLSREDKDLAENNLSYILANPCRIEDTSWIRSGKASWDWWNQQGLKGVDFHAGMNTATLKYFIDFSSRFGLEYMLIDAGWSGNSLLERNPNVDLEELVLYANEKNVGLFLWAGYQHFDRDMEKAVQTYSEMGIKGFKIDFIDSDDQKATDFYYRAAKTCAKYHLLIDFHGAFKPAGLNRTYPNALNWEGVNGLETMKWNDESHDQMEYDCQVPFIRQTAGPEDYTPGAMLNAAKGNFYPCDREPMSQGTRCHQMALYVTFDAPLNMLCDSPTNYEADPDCTTAIASIPTTWDETHILCGEIGKYIVTARRKGSTWYIGGTTNWDARDVEFTLPSSIAVGSNAELFEDGVNADRKGEDYKHISITTERTMKIHLAPGGGFLMKI